MARLRTALAVAACAALTLLAAPVTPARVLSASDHPAIGIGDENLALFSDPRFLALGIRDVRVDMPWDVLSSKYRSHYRRNLLEAWLADARADGLQPLVVFDHSDRRGQSGRLPSVRQFSAAFRQFRRRYPWVTQFVTWDEANYYGEKIAQAPRRAAGYYLALRRDCPACTISAPDLLDLANGTQAVPMVRWAHMFIHYAHGQPAYWALNNYASANLQSLRSIRELLRSVDGDIWLAETGGIVRFPHHGRPGFPLTLRHEAAVDRFLLTRVAALSPRIQRIYLYEWRPPTRHASWDTALLSYNGAPRPAYDVLANALDAWGITPNCAVSRAPAPCTAGGSTGASGPTGTS